MERRIPRKGLHCPNLPTIHILIYTGAPQGMGSQGAATASGKCIDVDVTVQVVNVLM